ncbi:MAG TPA: MFS transporter [bacterium]|nr:MFS transporter [bacterium]
MQAIAPAPSRRGTLHARVTLLAGLAFGSNGVNLGVVSFALLGLKASWGLTPGQAGLLIMAAGAGQLAGGILVGHLADWMGRRVGYGATVALNSLATGAAALAPSLPWMLLVLFLAGIGFGGVAPVATSLVGEFAPRRSRGALIGWTQVVWILGWILAAVGGVVAAHGLGWRSVFLVGLVPLALAVIGPWLVPESPRYLLAHGRRREAEALARALSERYGVTPELPVQEQADHASIFAHLAELWSPRFRRHSFVLWAVWFVMISAYNGPIIWLPALLSAEGFPNPAQAALLVALVMGLPVVAASLLIDRVGRKPVIVCGLILGAAGAAGVGAARTEVEIIAAAMALAGGVLAAWPVILSYAAELYPTRIRATAMGWASAAGRSGGIVAPALLGRMMRSWTTGRAPALSIFAGTLVIGALIIIFFGEETAGRSLEETAGVT